MEGGIRSWIMNFDLRVTPMVGSVFFFGLVCCLFLWNEMNFMEFSIVVCCFSKINKFFLTMASNTNNNFDTK